MNGLITKLFTLIYSSLTLLALLTTRPGLPGVHTFVLQELPLFRSERMDPRGFLRSDRFAGEKFDRELRSYNFPRWNRLHNYWSKDDVIFSKYIPKKKI